MPIQFINKQFKSIKDEVSYGLRLEQQTLGNYKGAINYFYGKEQTFINYALKKSRSKLKKDGQLFKERFTQMMGNQLTEEWEKVRKAVLGQLDVEAGKSGAYALKEGAETHINGIAAIPEKWRQRIIDGAGGAGNIHSMLGFVYEEFAETFMHSTADIIHDQKKRGLDHIIAGVIQEFNHTGALTSKSAARTAGSIRPDLALGVQLKTNKDGVLYGKQGNKKLLPVELQVELELNYDAEEQRLKISDEELLQHYMQENIFGLQVKNWQGSNFNDKTFTQITSLQTALNKILTSVPIHYQFANQVVAHEVSRRIFDITGINTMGLLTGKRFIWMSDLLNEYIFNMNINITKEISKDSGFVRIANPDVILRRAADLSNRAALFSKYVGKRKAVEIKDNNSEKRTEVPLTFGILRKSRS